MCVFLSRGDWARRDLLDPALFPVHLGPLSSTQRLPGPAGLPGGASCLCQQPALPLPGALNCGPTATLCSSSQSEGLCGLLSHGPRARGALPSRPSALKEQSKFCSGPLPAAGRGFPRGPWGTETHPCGKPPLLSVQKALGLGQEKS